MKQPDLTSVSGAIIAKVLGVPRRTHTHLVKRKVLPKSNRDRQYDLPASVAAYLEFKLNAATPSSAADEKRRVLKETADKLALANERQRGRLVYSDHVAWILNASASQMVMLLQALPGRAVAAMQGITDGGAQREILLEQIRAIRTSVADFLTTLPDAPDYMTATQKTAIQSLIGVDTHHEREKDDEV